ncbi:flagellar motor protein MotB [uncultured Sphingomonas sp.]|uniref:flagellar motor protein MotB n=1 Tax=uncultured Sphingomonas sp. TaxID=158754 RepID=UPI0035CAD0CB
MTDELPLPPAARPLWLVTLADLALLLVGFLVLVNASQRIDRHALARGFRQGFDTVEAPPRPAPPPMPVAAAASPDFAPGTATLSDAPTMLIDWARGATRDPRVLLTITGSVDGSAGDIDAATGSGAILAADRARTVAAALIAAHVVAPGRLAIATAMHTGRRDAVATLAFAGETR